MVNKARAKTKSSRRWLDRQHSDPYVAQAREAGFRSRSAYKLMELHERDKLFKKGMTIVDLGAAPGGWSQVAIKCVGESGKVLAMDILPMDPIKGVDIVQGDFQKIEVLEELVLALKGKPVDLVISDMAPNLSGIAAADQARALNLSDMALQFAERVLDENGGFLIKIFQGAGSQEYLTNLKQRFNQVVVRKPKASRAESREIYFLAKGYKLNGNETRGAYLERYA